MVREFDVELEDAVGAAHLRERNASHRWRRGGDTAAHGPEERLRVDLERGDDGREIVDAPGAMRVA